MQSVFDSVSQRGRLNRIPDAWFCENGNDGYAIQIDMFHYANKETASIRTPDLHWIAYQEFLGLGVEDRRAVATAQIVFCGLTVLGLEFATKFVSPLELVEVAFANLQSRVVAKHLCVLLFVHYGELHMLAMLYALEEIVEHNMPRSLAREHPRMTRKFIEQQVQSSAESRRGYRGLTFLTLSYHKG